MKVKIWGITPRGKVYTKLYENVTKYEIIPLFEDYNSVADGFFLVMYQGKEKITRALSINATFTFEQNQLYVEINDYN